MLRSTFIGLLLAALLLTAPTACYRDSHPRAGDASRQQLIVDRSAEALLRMRSMRGATLDYFLQNAVGVMIFPRVIKASLIFGGEGGSGVLLARDPSGFSSPAFYSLGGGSAGLQIGYQEATIVLFFMNEAALRSAISRGLTLGADASVAAGNIGDSGQALATKAASDIYQFVEVGGLFAGVSLNGTVVAARESSNLAYYGPGASTAAILLERRFASPGAQNLLYALSPGAVPAPAFAPALTPTTLAPPTTPGSPTSSPAPAQYQCQRDEDCTLTRWACSPCGSCDGPSWAVNAAWQTRMQSQCQPMPANVPPPNCAPCTAPNEQERPSWPTRAVCEAGSCVAR